MFSDTLSYFQRRRGHFLALLLITAYLLGQRSAEAQATKPPAKGARQQLADLDAAMQDVNSARQKAQQTLNTLADRDTILLPIAITTDEGKLAGLDRYLHPLPGE